MIMRTILIVGLSAWLAACVSTESSTRRAEPSEDAAYQNYQLGAQYYRNGSYELARDRLERAIDLDPRHAQAHSLLALTFVQLGIDRLAEDNFARSVRLAPDSKDIRNAYAVYLCQRREFDEAIEQFDRAIGIRENDSRWIEMTNAGVCVAQKPDLALAEQYFRDALSVRPTYGEALIQMAALKHRTEDNLTARAFLQRYLASNPASSSVLYLAVQIETRLGDERAATDYMNNLLRDFPESSEAKLMLQQGEQAT
jgi:type IV pilus assembly protein PilF